MSNLNPPLSSQGELFANDYPLPSHAAVEYSIKKTLSSNEQTDQEERETHQSDECTPLINFLNPKSKIVQLTQRVNWQAILQQLGNYYRHNDNHYDSRQLVAMYILCAQNEHNYALTLSLWLENPYWQFFCGMQHFQTQLPFDTETLQDFSHYVQNHHFHTLHDLSQQFAKLSIKTPLKRQFQGAKLTKRPTKNREIYENKPILQPVFIQWYQDYLFYIYFLIAISFWVIYALIFPANWPNQALTLKQWQAFFYIVLGYPIVEEIIFRGGLQRWLYHYHWGKITSIHISVANVIVSLIFSFLHIIVRPEDPSTYGIIIPSLIFGLFRDRHGHIISCTLLHIFYNMGIFFLLILPTIT